MLYTSLSTSRTSDNRLCILSLYIPTPKSLCLPIPLFSTPELYHRCTLIYPGNDDNNLIQIQSLLLHTMANYLLQILMFVPPNLITFCQLLYQKICIQEMSYQNTQEENSEQRLNLKSIKFPVLNYRKDLKSIKFLMPNFDKDLNAIKFPASSHVTTHHPNTAEMATQTFNTDITVFPASIQHSSQLDEMDFMSVKVQKSDQTGD